MIKKHILLVVAALSAMLFSCTKPENPDAGPVTPPAEEFDINSLSPGLSSDPADLQADRPCTLYYKAGGSFPFSGFSGELYAHIGLVNFEWEHVQAGWDENTEKCRWQKTEVPNVWKLPIEPSIRAWFGASEEESVTKIGVVVRSADGKQQTKPDFYLSVKDDGK